MMNIAFIDDALLAKLRQQDHASWALVYERFAPRLYAYIERRSGLDCEVEDIVQETMLAAVRAFPSYTAQAQLYTWIVSIANHKIADHWRRRRPVTSLSVCLSTPPPTEGAIVQEAIDRLPPDYRAVLMLRYLGGFSVGEVAQQIGRSYKATESLLSRAREMLRNILDEPVA